MKRLTFPHALGQLRIDEDQRPSGNRTSGTTIVRLCASIVFVFLGACTSLAVSAPADGSTVSLPQVITIKESVGLDGWTRGPQTILIDGVDAEKFTNVNYSVPSGSVLCCVAPGSHRIEVSGHTSSRTVTGSSSFTVDANGLPGFYACPAGAPHPVFGMCCDTGSCDVPAASNFGPWRFPAPASCPSSTWANDCLNQNANGICGPNGTGCSGITSMVAQMVAVSFTPSQSGALRQIQVPIGFRNGTRSFQAWITTSVNGTPGAPLETFMLSNVRAQPFPVRSPEHIFSVTHPALSAGTTYWLVIGPAASDAVGSWNYSLTDAPSAGGANYLVNSTAGAGNVPQLTGPWTAASGSPLRPAFEIDIR